MQCCNCAHSALRSDQRILFDLPYRIGVKEYKTTADVAEAAALSRQTIDRYIRNGEINAPVQRIHGKRTVRTYTDAEFDEVIRQIKNLGKNSK